MGMMILHQFDRENSLTDSDEDQDRRVEEIENNEEENNDDEMNDVEDSKDGSEGKFSTDEDEEVDKDKGACVKADNVGKKFVKTDVVVKANGKNGRSVESVSEKPNDNKSDSESDYGSDEEGKVNEAINSVAEVNTSAEDAGKSTEQTTSMIDEMIANVLARSPDGNKNHTQNLKPPDAHWSDTDDDAEDDKIYNIEEFIKYGAQGKTLEPPRKSRYSSSTSVDTSTTSGIGSFVEEHLEEEMGQCDSEKTSPGWSHLDPEPGCSENKTQKMDVEESESEEEKVSDEEEDVPKLSLSVCMKEAIDSLPLPSSMKSYIKYYRD
jgi:hypothetical protein